MSVNTQTHQNNGTNGNGNGSALAKASHPMDRIKRDLEAWKPTLKAILPKHIQPERVIKIMCSMILQNPNMQKCTPESIVRATVQCAELGLDPSPLLGECVFLPYNNKVRIKDGNTFKDVTRMELQLQPMYVGLIKLAKQTGEISDIYSVVVDESEMSPVFEDGRLVEGFYVEQGTIRKIQHVQKIQGRTGKIAAAYGVVKFRDGTVHFEVLSADEVYKQHRARSKGYSTNPAESPWTTDEASMFRKALIKQVVKYIPKSPEKPQFAAALAADTSAETGEAFSTELTATIVPADELTDPEPAQLAPATRTEALADRLAGTPAHDADGVMVEGKRSR